jgi:hypothetical protein
MDSDGKPYPLLLERASTLNREAYPLTKFFDAQRQHGIATDFDR